MSGWCGPAGWLSIAVEEGGVQVQLHHLTPSSAACSPACFFSEGLCTEIVISHWFCPSIAVPCPSVLSPTPGCVNPCIIWLLQVICWGSRLSQTQCCSSWQEGTDVPGRNRQVFVFVFVLPCASRASLAPSSNPQVLLRPLLAVSLVGSGTCGPVALTSQHRLLPSHRSPPVGGTICTSQ